MCNQENHVRICGSDKKSAFLTFFFALLLVFSFGLAKVESASAADPDVICVATTKEGKQVKETMKESTAKTGCVDGGAWCKTQLEKLNEIGNCHYYTSEQLKEVEKAQQDIMDNREPADNSPLSTIFKWLLRGVLTVVGWFIAIAATLFEWIIQPASLNAVLSNPVIYKTWMLVRDTLNVAFILTLLFSAFATIFQVSKFSYKNILLTLVIMALLVNFSFPISRVIVDFSNVIMYYFLNGLDGSGTGSFAQIADKGKLSEILNPGESADITFLIAAIIFSFIFAVTILVIAVLLIIRTIALAFLIIFSPIAFVGSIVPFLSGHASKWWDNLFKYSFFGPIMVFMIYIAVEMMKEITLQGANFVQIANVQSTGGIQKFIAAGSFFAIPIVILWIGIGTAQSMSIAGAGAVVGRGQKFMKWAGKGTYKAPWAGIKKTGAPGAVKQRYDQWKKEGLLGSERQAQREAWMSHKLGVKGAKEKDMKRRAEEFKKNLAQPDELKALAIKGDAAAAYRLAEDKDMDQETYEKFLAANKDSSLHKAVNSKLKQNRADIVATYNAKASAKEKVEKMTATDIATERADAVGKGIAGASTWSDDQVKDYAREKEMRLKAIEEIGNLGAEKFSEQSWKDITKLEPGKTYTPDQVRAIKAAISNLYGMSGTARAEVSKRISSTQKKALQKAARDLGLTVPAI